MKKLLTCFVIIASAILSLSFCPPSFDSNDTQVSAPDFIITVDENNEIVSVAAPDGINQDGAWRIRDVSGYTNIRNKPRGKVCMRLKAYTDYAIYANGSQSGWLRIAAIYNISDRYWVRLHSSSTGTYWIAKSILY